MTVSHVGQPLSIQGAGDQASETGQGPIKLASVSWTHVTAPFGRGEGPLVIVFLAHFQSHQWQRSSLLPTETDIIALLWVAGSLARYQPCLFALRHTPQNTHIHTGHVASFCPQHWFEL